MSREVEELRGMNASPQVAAEMHGCNYRLGFP